jgi:predicted dehydrogenase
MSISIPDQDLSRRKFLKTTGVAAAGLSALGNFAAAADAPNIERSAHPGGGDTIKLALVGCGGRGSGAADAALKTGNVKLVAMADTFDDQLQSHLSILSKNHPNKVDVPQERQFTGFDGYKKAIAEADVVILATPPGFRPIHFEEAVAQGKNAFLEKPVATDAPGVRRVLAANEEAKKKGLKVGVGFQRHHQKAYIETLARLRDGAIGDLLDMRVYWRGASRGGKPRLANETEMQYQIRNWYFYTWLSGDHIVEQHCHNIDVGNWIKGTHPIRANGIGGRQSRISKECGQIFDHHYAEFEYADGTRMFSQCSQFPHGWGRMSEHVRGTKGTVDLNLSNQFVIKGANPWRFEGKGGDPYQVEHDDLFAAIRENKPYNEADYAAYSTMTAIMGRMATYSGMEVEWDAAFNCAATLLPSAFSWDTTPPVVPEADGFYPVARPGETLACDSKFKA